MKMPKDAKCEICKTNREGEAVFVGIDGTEEGNNMRAGFVHVKCLSLRINTDEGVIYQKLN